MNFSPSVCSPLKPVLVASTASLVSHKIPLVCLSWTCFQCGLRAPCACVGKVHEQASPIHAVPAAKTLEKHGVTSPSFLCPNDSEHHLPFPFKFYVWQLGAQGWHFRGAVHCKSRMSLLPSHGWLTGQRSVCGVGIVFPTCIFDIYLYWISSAVSSVIAFQKVLLQFLSQPLSSLPWINW